MMTLADFPERKRRRRAMGSVGRKIKHKLGRSMNEFERPSKKNGEGKGEWMGDQDDQDQNKRKKKKKNWRA